MTLRHLSLLITLLASVESSATNLDDRFNSLTTPVVVSISGGKPIHGTAFFYQHLAAPADPTKTGPQWRALEEVWIVTNRHLVLPKVNDKEVIPDEFIFMLRKVVNNQLQWESISLKKHELLARAKFIADTAVDVAVIRISDLLMSRFAEKGGPNPPYKYSAVSPENFVGKNNIEVQASDDVVIIGYPRGYYDKVNLYPIVKAGIVASRWGANFNGEPYFLIDAKLFPGSSGSLVVSKPMNLVVSGGQLLRSNEKQFAFLGVYSGEPYNDVKIIETDELVIKQRYKYNLGVVWYAWLIEEIIENGVAHKQ